MNSTIQRKEDNTIELKITIPQSVVKDVWDKIVNEAVKNTTLPGFRKGKAPRKIVEEKLDKQKIKEEVLKELLPKAYLEAIKQHNITPIMNPKLHVEKLEDPSTDSGQVGWEFTAVTCEMPQVNLGDYKNNIKKVTAKSKIVIPGKTQEPAKFEDIVKALLESISAIIPQVLLDQEVDRLLALMLDDVKKLGLTLDQYLSSNGKTPQSLRLEYEQRARNDLKFEFALQKIAEAERISIEEKEIEEAIQKAKDEKERKNLENNRYLLAGILRQQKTLDFLRNL